MRLVNSARRYLKRLWFRITHGFWPEEWYSLDTALAKWLSVRLAYLQAYTETTPASYIDQHGPTGGWVEWREDLRLVSEALERYANMWEADTIEELKEIEQGGQDAMLWVAHNFRDLWD